MPSTSLSSPSDCRARQPIRLLTTLALVACTAIASACAGASEPARPHADARSAATVAPPAPIPQALQNEVEAELRRRVAEAEAGDESTIQVALHPPASAPQRVLVVVAHSEGRGIQVSELIAEPNGGARFSSVVAKELPPAGLDSAPPKLDLYQKILGPADATRLLQRAALAVSAEIEAQVGLLPTNPVNETQVLGVRLWSADGRMIDRRFDGRPGNLAEPRRAPVALIREDLESLASPVDRTGVNAQLRAMIVDAWPAPGAMPAWTRARLLAVASALPSHPLVALVEPSLDETGEPRVRAINALAAATEVDLRRDASGGLRGVDEVAEAYRKLLDKR
jgi:hypothetical protein